MSTFNSFLTTGRSTYPVLQNLPLHLKVELHIQHTIKVAKNLNFNNGNCSFSRYSAAISCTYMNIYVCLYVCIYVSTVISYSNQTVCATQITGSITIVRIYAVMIQEPYHESERLPLEWLCI